MVDNTPNKKPIGKKPVSPIEQIKSGWRLYIDPKTQKIVLRDDQTYGRQFPLGTLRGRQPDELANTLVTNRQLAVTRINQLDGKIIFWFYDPNQQKSD